MKLLVIAAIAVMCTALTGCNRTERATAAAPGAGFGAYLPGENFADGGASRCGTINIPSALKPCGE